MKRRSHPVGPCPIRTMAHRGRLKVPAAYVNSVNSRLLRLLALNPRLATSHAPATSRRFGPAFPRQPTVCGAAHLLIWWRAASRPRGVSRRTPPSSRAINPSRSACHIAFGAKSADHRKCS